MHPYAKYALFVVPAIALLWVGGCSATTVESGHRGVKKTFGAVSPTPLDEGLHFYNPFTTEVIEMDARVLKWVGATEAYTQDIQQAGVTFTITYRLNPAKAAVVYRDVGRNWAERQLPQVVTQALKDEFGRWGAVQLIANRSKAQGVILRAIRNRMASANVEVIGFEITDISYSPDFEKAVENKEVAVQRAIEERNKTVQVEEQARQTGIRATAEAESMRIRSQALESNPKLVEWEAVQKWNGKLPQNMYGSAPLPFIGVGK